MGLVQGGAGGAGGDGGAGGVAPGGGGFCTFIIAILGTTFTWLCSYSHVKSGCQDELDMADAMLMYGAVSCSGQSTEASSAYSSYVAGCKYTYTPRAWETSTSSQVALP